MAMAVRVHQSIGSWQPRAVKRVYIAKAGNRAKLRPLGIPVIADRCHQGRVRAALEPEWEARFEPKSYGFRPGRSCQDAIKAVHTTSNGPRAKRLWALDADLAKAFDKIDHPHLLAQLGSFPARDLIRDWLKAGVFEAGKGFAPTEEGTPQGGVISPLILNVALHGMEQAAGVRYVLSGASAGTTRADSPVVIRYADDLVALCHSQEQAQQVKARLAEWLAPRGLAFNDEKTAIVPLDSGFDFLGFHVRRYGDKLLIKPSKPAIKRIRARLSTQMRALRGTNAQAVIATIAPIVRGWSAYYRAVAAKEVFSSLDHYLWQLTYKWATWSHRNKPRAWIVQNYYGKFHPARQDRWVFGHRDSGAYLPRFAWTKIVRHPLVPGRASPDDPALTQFWAERRRKHQPPLDRSTLRMIKAQNGRCPTCGDFLLHAAREPNSPQEWEHWLTGVRKAITRHNLAAHPDDATPDRIHLVHASCHRRTTGTNRTPAPPT
jgi:RNA-directed DNA polymerase